MTAVAKLDAMKRIAAFVAVREKMAGTDPEVITESNGVPLLMSDLRAALSPAELGGMETEQSIAADCYHWIAECIGTLPGYSVQEHVQTMKETLDACSDFLHDFVPSDEGGCDEAVELARNCRAVLSGRIEARDAADARRYRWLRSLPTGPGTSTIGDFHFTLAQHRPAPNRWCVDSVRGDSLDAAIDAALALPAQGEGENG